MGKGDSGLGSSASRITTVSVIYRICRDPDGRDSALFTHDWFAPTWRG
jgi:hypothetical protein